MSSRVDPTLAPLVPFFHPSSPSSDPVSTQRLIEKLELQKNIEGGYFVETDRDPLLVPNPFYDAKYGDPAATDDLVCVPRREQ
jgi:hypothetical protein